MLGTAGVSSKPMPNKSTAAAADEVDAVEDDSARVLAAAAGGATTAGLDAALEGVAVEAATA